MSGRAKVLVIGDDTRSFLSTVRSLGRQGIEVHAAPFDFRSPALASRYIRATHFLPYYLDGGLEWLDAMRRLLAACDLLALPSLQDNLPNTLVEAMACGTPAVGSAIGGIPDLVEHGATGLLAAPGDAVQLAGHLETLLRDDPLRLRMGEAARQRVERDCGEGPVGERYAAIYRDALAAFRDAASR